MYLQFGWAGWLAGWLVCWMCVAFCTSGYLPYIYIVTKRLESLSFAYRMQFLYIFFSWSVCALVCWLLLKVLTLYSLSCHRIAHCNICECISYMYVVAFCICLRDNPSVALLNRTHGFNERTSEQESERETCFRYVCTRYESAAAAAAECMCTARCIV